MTETELHDRLIDAGLGEAIAHDLTAELGPLVSSEDVLSSAANAMEVAMNALEQAKSDLAEVEIIVGSLASDTVQAITVLKDAIKLIDG